MLMQDHGGATPIQRSMLVSSTWMFVSRDSLRCGTVHQLSSLEHNQDQQEPIPAFTVFPCHDFLFMFDAKPEIPRILPKCSLVCSYFPKQYPNLQLIRCQKLTA